VNGELRVVEDVAEAFAAEVAAAFRERPAETFSLTLCGGSTGRLCYRHLAQHHASALDWWDVDFYWGDERCVPADHPDSNQRMAREVLLAEIGGANAIYPMSCEEGPEAYQLRIAEAGRLDVIHLGMGADGHTASLFPDSPGLDAGPGQLVVLNHDPSGRNPHPRMTLTFAGIERARTVVFTVTGAEKAEALAAVRDGADLPAARVRAERVLWLVDRAAAPWASSD